MEELYKKTAEIIKNSKTLIALTGAGHSVESGIPDFRGPDGLWTRFDPMVYAHIDTFRTNPEKTWELLFEMEKITNNAKPNPAHYALARLEELGYLKAIITQNIDNLHQEAGNKNVIEFHGNNKKFHCIKCGAEYDAGKIHVEDTPPTCAKCTAVLKPMVVFFGEMIPQDALHESMNLAGIADAVMVIGTSAQVYPAADIPYIAKHNGASVIEMNLEETNLTHSITDIFIQGNLKTTLPDLLKYVEK